MSSESSDSASDFSDFPSEEELSEHESQLGADDDDTASRKSGTAKQSRIPTADFPTTPGIKNQTMVSQKGNKVVELRSPVLGEPDYRRTLRQMTIYEYTRLIGSRAEMISKNEPIHPKYRDVPTIDLCEIAKMELDDLDIPFPIEVVRYVDRPSAIDSKIREIFNVRELDLPDQVLNAGIDDYLPKMEWAVNKQL